MPVKSEKPKIRPPHYDGDKECLYERIVEIAATALYSKPSRFAPATIQDLPPYERTRIMQAAQTLEKEFINVVASEVHLRGEDGMGDEHQRHRIKEHLDGATSTLANWKKEIERKLAEAYVRLQIPDIDTKREKFEADIQDWAANNLEKPRPRKIQL